jgi:hypothetical protein
MRRMYSMSSKTLFEALQGACIEFNAPVELNFTANTKDNGNSHTVLNAVW